MAKQHISVERTSAGLQLVIPGTEKPAAPPRIAYAKEGLQLVIPGAERISCRELMARLSQRPLRPRVNQRCLAGTSLLGAR